MDRTDIRKLVWAAAVIAVAAGTAMTVRSIMRIPACREELDRHISNIKDAAEVQRESLKNERAVKAFEQIANPKATPVNEIIRDMLPGDAFKTRELPAPPALSGWTARKTEIVFERTELPKLAAFIVAAEQMRPPWHVTECMIRPLSPEGTDGYARLVLEALERTP